GAEQAHRLAASLGLEGVLLHRGGLTHDTRLREVLHARHLRTEHRDDAASQSADRRRHAINELAARRLADLAAAVVDRCTHLADGAGRRGDMRVAPGEWVWAQTRPGNAA